MMEHDEALAWIGAAGSGGGVAIGVNRELRLSWGELASFVSGRSAKVTLADHQWVQGKILAVGLEGLSMRVADAQDQKRFPSRKLLVPRVEVAKIRIERYSKHWRAILTPGISAAALLAMAFAANQTQPTPDPAKVAPIGMGVTAGAVLGGYYIGKRLDRREVLEISVSP